MWPLGISSDNFLLLFPTSPHCLKAFNASTVVGSVHFVIIMNLRTVNVEPTLYAVCPCWMCASLSITGTMLHEIMAAAPGWKQLHAPLSVTMTQTHWIDGFVSQAYAKLPCWFAEWTCSVCIALLLHRHVGLIHLSCLHIPNEPWMNVSNHMAIPLSFSTL